jgi:hypothetical protein
MQAAGLTEDVILDHPAADQLQRTTRSDRLLAMIDFGYERADPVPPFRWHCS